MTHHPPSTLLSTALNLAALGWPVFPLRPGDKRPALHGDQHCPGLGDCAAGHRKWEQRATTDPERICAAWARSPFNIGIATGPAGLLVIDLDLPKRGKEAPSGRAAFEALCERAGQSVPTTYRVRTASGGEHLYFTAPPGTQLGNTASRLAPLVDTRAWGGYVVAPGSLTAAGPYEVTDPSPVSDLPGWLLPLLQPPAPVPGRRIAPTTVSGTRAARAALGAECAAVLAAPAGQANNTLNRSAFKVGRFVVWGDLPRDVVEGAFQAAGEERGLTAAECRATIRSALDSSARTRDAA
ncbi:bifunctional DNA primase/polymerase [Streptomyces sp. NPDC006879]|uniref:bifunctional DNA primase/polymerase n=1 Tax=Streptomyces sp. NPDC006879 TaxID=3364767 RepID=UPI0036A9118C